MRAERHLLSGASRRSTNPTYTVGSDVSRFQRSTVPARPRDNNNQPGNGRPAPRGAMIDAPMGPMVRIARGNNVTIVPVGAR